MGFRYYGVGRHGQRLEYASNYEVLQKNFQKHMFHNSFHKLSRSRTQPPKRTKKNKDTLKTKACLFSHQSHISQRSLRWENYSFGEWGGRYNNRMKLQQQQGTVAARRVRAYDIYYILYIVYCILYVT